MTSSIIILSEDKYIREALKSRLVNKFSSFYIISSSSIQEVKNFADEVILLSDFIHVIYDLTWQEESLKLEVTKLWGENKSYSFYPLNIDFNQDALFISHIVDCLNSTDSFNHKAIGKSSNYYQTPEGSLVMLFAYTTVDKREQFIKKCSSEFIDELTVRFNLMSDYKWPLTTFCSPSLEPINNKTLENGSFTKLMRDITELGISKINPIDYCIMDNLGFLNPGPFDPGDEIFNYKFDQVLDLIERIKEISSSSQIRLKSLAVVQDFRRSEAVMLAQKATSIIVLLPLDDSLNLNLINEEVNIIKKSIRSDIDFKIERI